MVSCRPEKPQAYLYKPETDPRWQSHPIQHDHWTPKSVICPDTCSRCRGIYYAMKDRNCMASTPFVSPQWTLYPV